MKVLLLSLFFCVAPVSAETLVFPVQDMLFEHPQFTDAPKFGLNEALHGDWTPHTPKKSERSTRREVERRLINILWNEYPDATSIRIWRGNMIIKLP